MRVIYKNHIGETIKNLILAADRDGKKIARIELTVDEANEFSSWIRSTLYIPDGKFDFRNYRPGDWGVRVGMFLGVKIVIES